MTASLRQGIARRAARDLPLAVAVMLTLLLAGMGTLRADDLSGAQAAAMGGLFLLLALVLVAAYVYFALALKTLAEKTKTENTWWAWVPILHLILMLNIAKKPVWWILLLLVPLLNIVIAVLAWMAIAEARHKPNWWGILMIVPLVNLIVPRYLAWSD